ncbi:MAG TPA: PAS domain-containing protein, partial [Spirochaetia bacterium]|nr:PAS domain-containing protein [Spirochaetia bacterium]
MLFWIPCAIILQTLFVRRWTTVFSDIILHIIEEISDGFLILNERGEIVFFNEVLLRLLDWRSRDILTHEKKFLEFLNADPSRDGDWKVKIASRAGKINSFSVHSFRVETEAGYYSLMRLKPDYAEDIQLTRNYRKDYHELFNNLDDGIITADIKGHILSANPAFLRLIGYDERDLPANIRNLYVYKDELDDKLMRVLKGGAVSNLETHLYTREGTIRRTLDSSWVVKDKRGELIGYTAQFKDITYLKNIESRLKISERNFTFLFDTILSSIVIVDPEGRIVNFNSAAEKMYGYSWEELVGEEFDLVLRYSKEYPTFGKIMSLIEKNDGTYIEPEVKRKTKNGDTIFTYASYTGIRNSADEIIAYSISEKDLTERVRLETKLKESIEQIKETQSAAILGFSKLTEYRD